MRRDRQPGDRRKGERRQQNGEAPPLDRREPWFTRGPEWQVWARKKAAYWILWGYDRGFVSQHCLAALIERWRPRHEENNR